MQREEIILFGAGELATYCRSVLEFLRIDFAGYVDNNPAKQGTMLRGKPIWPPEVLKERPFHIILASIQGDAMRRQLDGMGLSGSYVTISRFFSEALHRGEFQRAEGMLRGVALPAKSKEPTVVFDALLGVGWAGTETWAYRAASGLLERGRRVRVYCSAMQQRAPAVSEEAVQRFDLSRPMDEWMHHLIVALEDCLPLCFVNNFSSYGLLAAMAVKRAYPGQVRIVSVVHNDLKGLHDQHTGWHREVDAYLCVSEKMRKCFVESYGIPAERVFYRPNPVPFDASFVRGIRPKGEPLHIGWAGRLEQDPKRADLFPDLIARLEEVAPDYRLEIAGEGPCAPVIQACLADHGLEDKVMLDGLLSADEMKEFWKRQDVYLNFSEYEGMCLAMLEAMSYGCAPVVTNVSGVPEIITHGVGGVVCPVGDLNAIAEGIALLEHDRDAVKRFGAVSRQTVFEQCRMENYIDFLEHIFDMGGR